MTTRLWIGAVLCTVLGCSEGTEAEVSEGPLDARLRVLGFGEPADFRRMVGRLRAAARAGDRAALADAIHYPFVRYRCGEVEHTYRDRAAVLERFDAIFSASVLKALRDARYESLFVRDQGAMIGRGEVWLSRFDEGVRITAVNP